MRAGLSREEQAWFFLSQTTRRPAVFFHYGIHSLTYYLHGCLLSPRLWRTTRPPPPPPSIFCALWPPRPVDIIAAHERESWRDHRWTVMCPTAVCCCTKRNEKEKTEVNVSTNGLESAQVWASDEEWDVKSKAIQMTQSRWGWEREIMLINCRLRSVTLNVWIHWGEVSVWIN